MCSLAVLDGADKSAQSSAPTSPVAPNTQPTSPIEPRNDTSPVNRKADRGGI